MQSNTLYGIASTNYHLHTIYIQMIYGEQHVIHTCGMSPYVFLNAFLSFIFSYSIFIFNYVYMYVVLPYRFSFEDMLLAPKCEPSTSIWCSMCACACETCSFPSPLLSHLPFFFSLFFFFFSLLSFFSFLSLRVAPLHLLCYMYLPFRVNNSRILFMSIL